MPTALATIVTTAKILAALVPMATRIGKAMKKNSPGGKRITSQEWLTIWLEEADDAFKKVNELVEDDTDDT